MTVRMAAHRNISATCKIRAQGPELARHTRVRSDAYHLGVFRGPSATVRTAKLTSLHSPAGRWGLALCEGKTSSAKAERHVLQNVDPTRDRRSDLS